MTLGRKFDSVLMNRSFKYVSYDFMLGGFMNKYAGIVNRVLLGLLMLVSGLMKIFVIKPEGVIGMLSGIGFPAASFFAWVLILSEIVFGIAILAKWKIEYTVWPPIVILIVAALTVYTGGENGPQWGQILIHLVLASNYWLVGVRSKAK